MITVSFAKSVKSSDVFVFATVNGKVKNSELSNADLKIVQNALKQSKFVAQSEKIMTVWGSAGKTIIAGVKDEADLTFQNLGGNLVSAVKEDETAVYYPATDSVNEVVQVAFGLLLGSYRFDKYLTKETADKKLKLKKMTFITDNPAQAKKLFQEKQIIAESVYLARDLCSEPANALTPKIFADKIKDLSNSGLSVDILTVKELKAKKFGMLLSVAQGSANEPRVAVMKWIGNPKKKTFDLGLVGKGVTFDSGGISLKPGANMGDMKQDMTGAAVVTATMRSFALRQVKQNIIGIVGLVENMPSGTATRPGDIVTSLSGQTVEILNTDAEGRLVLGDCLWYMQSTYGVKKIVDLATLTGAVMMALGEEYAGLFANNDVLADNLTTAGQETGEHLWRLPMNKAYNKMLDSPIADMKNIGGRYAGGSTAACFLGRFIKEDTVWAHLDIAGVDSSEKGTPTCPKGSSGWGVRLLNAFIK